MVNIILIFSFMGDVFIPNIVLLSAAKIFRFHMQSELCIIAYVHIATATVPSTKSMLQALHN